MLPTGRVFNRCARIQAGLHEVAYGLANNSINMILKLGSPDEFSDKLIYSYGHLAHLELQVDCRQMLDLR